jgi:glyoxylase I family protein
MYKGLEHTAIASPDPRRLAQWYVDHLGFHINFEYAGNYFVKAPNGTMLEIIPSEGERTPQAMKSPGIRHLAIAVDSFSDADGNIVHLIEREKPLP